MSWAVFRTTLSLAATVFFFGVNLIVRIIKWLWSLLTEQLIYLLPLFITLFIAWYGAAVWRENHHDVVQTVDFYYCETEDWRVLAYETWHNNLYTIEAGQCIANVVIGSGRILVWEFVKLTILDNPRKLLPLFEAIVETITGAIRASVAFLSNPFDFRFNFFLIWDGYLEIVNAIEGIFEDVCTDLFPAFQLVLSFFKKEELCCVLFHGINAPLRLLPEIRNLILGDPDYVNPDTGEPEEFTRVLPQLAPFVRELCAAVLCLGDYVDGVVVDLQIILFGDERSPMGCDPFTSKPPLTPQEIADGGNPRDGGCTLPTIDGQPPVDLGLGCVASRIFCFLGEGNILISNTVVFFANRIIEAIIAGEGIRVPLSDRPLVPGLGPGMGTAGNLPVVEQALEIIGSLLDGLLGILGDLSESLDWEPIFRVTLNEACREEDGSWDPLLCDKPVSSADGDNDYDACDPVQNPTGFGFTSLNGRNFYSAMPGCGPQLAECVGYTVGLVDVCVGQTARYIIVAIARFAEFIIDLVENGNLRFGELLAGPLLDVLGASSWDDFTSYGEFSTVVYNPDGTVNERAVKNEDLLDVHIDVDDQHEEGGRPYTQTALTCVLSNLLAGGCGTALADVGNAAGHIVLIPILIGQEFAWSDYEFEFGENPLETSEGREEFEELELSIVCIVTDRALLALDIVAHFIGCIPGLEVLEDVLVLVIGIFKEVIDTVKLLLVKTFNLAMAFTFWVIGLLFGDGSLDFISIFFEMLFEWLLELFDVILALVEGIINFLLFFWFPAIFGQNTLMDDDGGGPATFTECFAEFEDCICGIAAQIFSSICLPWPIDKCVSDMFGSCGCFDEDWTTDCAEDRRRAWHIPGPHYRNNGTAPWRFEEYLAIQFNDTVCGPTFDEFRYGKPDDAGEVAVLKYIECVGAAREALLFSAQYPGMEYKWPMQPQKVRQTGANATKGMSVLLVSEIMNNVIYASDPDELLDRPEKNATYIDLSEELQKRGINDTVAVNVLYSMQGSIRNGTKSFINFLNNSGSYHSDFYEKNVSLLDVGWETGKMGLAIGETLLYKMGKNNVTQKFGAGFKAGYNYWTHRLSKVPEAARETLERRSLQRREVNNIQNRLQETRRMAKRMDEGLFPKHISGWDITQNTLVHTLMAAKGYFGYLFYRPLPPPVHNHSDHDHNDTDTEFQMQNLYSLQDHRPNSCNKIVEYGCSNRLGKTFDGKDCDDPTAVTPLPVRFYENSPLCQYFFGLGAVFTCEGNESSASFYNSLVCDPSTLIATQTKDTPNCFFLGQAGLGMSDNLTDCGDRPCMGYMCVMECAACPTSQVIPDFQCQYLDNSMHRIRELIQNCLDKIGGPALDPTLAPPFDDSFFEDNWVPPEITQRQGTELCGDGIVQIDAGEECDLGVFPSDPNKEDPDFPFGRNYPCSGCNGCFLEFCGNDFPDCRPGSAPIAPDEFCNSTISMQPPEIWCDTGIVLSDGECPGSTNLPVAGRCCPSSVCSDSSFPTNDRCCVNANYTQHSGGLCCETGANITNTSAQCIASSEPSPDTFNVGNECCQFGCLNGVEPISGRCCEDGNFSLYLAGLCCESGTEILNVSAQCVDYTPAVYHSCIASTASTSTFMFELGRVPFGGFVEECDGMRGCSPGGIPGGEIPNPDNPALGGNASLEECIRMVCGDGRLVPGNICPAGAPPVCYGLIYNTNPFQAPFERVEIPLPLGSDASLCQPNVNLSIVYASENLTIVDPNAACVAMPRYCNIFKEFFPCSRGVVYSEECDDGNRKASDGCDTQCRAEICPDVYFSPGTSPQAIADAEVCANQFWGPILEDELGIEICDRNFVLREGACNAAGDGIEPTLPICRNRLNPEDNCVVPISAMRPNECFNDPANPGLLEDNMLFNDHTGQPFQGSVQFNCRGREKWLWVYQDKDCRGNYYIDESMGPGCSTECVFNINDETVYVRGFTDFSLIPVGIAEVAATCPSYVNYGLDLSCSDNCYVCGNNITEPGEQCDDGTLYPTVNPNEDACIACQNSCTCQEGKPCMGFCFGPDYATPNTMNALHGRRTGSGQWGRSDGLYGVPCNAQFESGLLGEGLSGYSPCGEGNICIPKVCCGDDSEGGAAASVDEEYSFDWGRIEQYFRDLEIACNPFDEESWTNGTCCFLPSWYNQKFLDDVCQLGNGDFVEPTDSTISLCTFHETDSRLMGRANPACAFQGIPWPIAVTARLEPNGEIQDLSVPQNILLKTKKQCDDSVDSTCVGCAQPSCTCQPGKRCVGRCIGGFWQGSLCDVNNPDHCKIGTYDLGLGKGPEPLDHLNGACVPEACCGDGVRQEYASAGDTGALVESCGGVCEGFGGHFGEMLTGAEITFALMEMVNVTIIQDMRTRARQEDWTYTGNFYMEEKAAYSDSCAEEEFDGRWAQRTRLFVFPFNDCNPAQNETRLFVGDDCSEEFGFRVTCDTVPGTWEAFNCSNSVLVGSGNTTECTGIFVEPLADTFYFKLDECIKPDAWNPPASESPPTPLYMNNTGAYMPTYCPGGRFTSRSIFNNDVSGYGSGCIAVWPCTRCNSGRDRDSEYDEDVHDASCPLILDANNQRHPVCTDDFIENGVDWSGAIDTPPTILEELIGGYESGASVLLDLCLTSDPGDDLPFSVPTARCDWNWWPGKLRSTGDDGTDDLTTDIVQDFEVYPMNMGFDRFINWTITTGNWYPCLAQFNISGGSTDNPLCCEDPNCGLPLPPRPGDEDGDGNLTLPMLPTFGEATDGSRKREFRPAAQLLQQSKGKHGKLAQFPSVKWADDQEKYLLKPADEQATAYDEYFHWLDENSPSEEEIRAYKAKHTQENARKRAVTEQHQPEQESERKLPEFRVQTRVRRQDPHARIMALGEGTPPKADVITPFIFDIVDFLIDVVVDFFIDTGGDAVDSFEDTIISFLTCDGVEDPFDLDSPERCIVWYLRFLVPLMCDLPGNFDCHIGIGLWDAVLYVGGGLVIVSVLGAYAFGSIFSIYFLLIAGLLGASLFAGVAWGFSIWCLPITPECLPREIDATLAIINGTCIQWPEGFVTNPPDGSCGKFNGTCIRREFTDCAEHGFIDGLDTVVFLGEWLLPDVMAWFRDSFLFTILTKFPIDAIAEYFTLTFARWDYSEQPISERDITCFFLVGISLLPVLLIAVLLIGLLLWPLIEILVDTLRDLWWITLGFSMWVEAIAESCEQDSIESLL